jgi:hypothetical protein
MKGMSLDKGSKLAPIDLELITPGRALTQDYRSANELHSKNGRQQKAQGKAEKETLSKPV